MPTRVIDAVRSSLRSDYAMRLQDKAGCAHTSDGCYPKRPHCESSHVHGPPTEAVDARSSLSKKLSEDLAASLVTIPNLASRSARTNAGLSWRCCIGSFACPSPKKGRNQPFSVWKKPGETEEIQVSAPPFLYLLYTNMHLRYSLLLPRSNDVEDRKQQPLVHDREIKLWTC